jgi:transposase
LMRPHMVFVPIKNEEQQAVLMLHRTRDLLVRQRTMLVNAIRAHLAEFGIVAAQGRRKVKDLITGLDNTEIPELARLALWQIADQIDECDNHIDTLERRILAWHKSDEASCNLATIPGIGPITASAIAATVPDPSAFRNGRQLAAWLGLVPRQNSSGGKDRLSDQRHPLCPEQGAGHGGVVEKAARPQIRSPGLGRLGQQDGAHRLVGADQGRGLSKHLSHS